MENNGSTQPGNAGKGHGDYLTINGFLEKTNTALTNASLPDIAQLMAARGYTAADIAEKLDDTARLRSLNELQKAEYGEQYNATTAYTNARDAVKEDYMDHVKLARVAFKNDTSAKTALGLRGTRAQSQSGYAGQGLLFYNNALNSGAFMQGLAKKGITKDDLQTGQKGFQNLETLTAAQQKETGEAQAATKLRDKAYDELHEWMTDFYETAKVALRKYPQLMEKIGIKEV